MTGYSEEGDEVVLRMTREDFNGLLILLGIAAGAQNAPQYSAAGRRAASIANMALRIANAINVGNPHWTPYRVEEDGNA